MRRRISSAVLVLGLLGGLAAPTAQAEYRTYNECFNAVFTSFPRGADYDTVVKPAIDKRCDHLYRS